MEHIYEDIAQRTGGDIYIGVVGPVRTGKSTFIKRFMETLVIPHIDNVYSRERARDELPQSGSGRTIMTAEPKFVPEEAVEITLSGGSRFAVRLIDCVGYMVDGAVGQAEDGEPRMVATPWFDYDIPMAEAAEIGTRKVIADHSTIGIVVTTDGSILDIPAGAYLEPEARVINELREIGKPFVVIVNSAYPGSSAASAKCEQLSRDYGVSAIAVNCLELSERDISSILKTVLYEFPVTELGINLPGWVEALPASHSIRTSLYSVVLSGAGDMRRIADVEASVEGMRNSDLIASAYVDSIDLGTGEAVATLDLPRSLFYDTISEQSGFAISDDGDLMGLLTGLADIKSEYEKVSEALRQVRETGYGVVAPSMADMRLEEPEIVKQSGRYGVCLRASAPSIHMLRADIKTEISPIVGSEKQSEDLIAYLLSEFEGDTTKLWESNIFGKSLHELVSEGLYSKLKKMPEDAQKKLRETLQRIINEGSAGLICIIL
ncbi:MAG: stage IV sporulation protein A [Oscillospiraceae bacterium]|jgi:stage IV sporulation protein A